MRCDICLILEGTYPYVAGGVSTWVAQLLEAMPHLQFAIVYIGARKQAPRHAKYVVPANVVELREVFLQDLPETAAWQSRSRLSTQDWEMLLQFQLDLAQGAVLPLTPVLPVLAKIRHDRELMPLLSRSAQAWQTLVQQYQLIAPPNTAFLDFFWTSRYIHLPLYHLLRQELPHARVYHTACTGFAGLLAAKAVLTTGRPAILTEHGIYTRERRIEIFNAQWIREAGSEMCLDIHHLESFFKHWWSSLFAALSRTTYAYSAHITTLFEANRQAQLAEGAPPERSIIIPNGIDVEAFSRLSPHRRQPGQSFTIGYIGRIGEIKDVKTLIRAFSILHRRGLQFQALLLGPMQEQAQYSQQCRDLVTQLELEQVVRFCGPVNIKAYLPRLDVVVLTSVSEGLPFVILEANCAGVPVVATDVGACAELLYGRTAADRQLGPSGIITAVGSPQQTAAALEKLAAAPELAAAMGDAGRQRVRLFYDLRDVMNCYQQLYEAHIYAGSQWTPGGLAAG